jgi:hypothetical protein
VEPFSGLAIIAAYVASCDFLQPYGCEIAHLLFVASPIIFMHGKVFAFKRLY